MSGDEERVRYAGFAKRSIAYAWDSLIVTLLSVLVMSLLGNTAQAHTAQDIQTLVDAGILPPGTNVQSLTALLGDQVSTMFSWSDLVLPLFISALYNIAFVAGVWQATPGKRWCGIAVTMEDGSKPTLLQSTLRHAASGLSMLFFGAGYLPMFFTRQKTAYHDMLCRTRVIYAKA